MRREESEEVEKRIEERGGKAEVRHTIASKVGMMERGRIREGKEREYGAEYYKKKKAIYRIGVDNIKERRGIEKGREKRVIYQGGKGEKGAEAAERRRPEKGVTERRGTYINTEGRVQESKEIVGGVGQAREGKEIIKARRKRMGEGKRSREYGAGKEKRRKALEEREEQRRVRKEIEKRRGEESRREEDRWRKLGERRGEKERGNR